MKETVRVAFFMGILLICSSAFAERASVACKSDYGGVTWRQGDCQYGEVVVGVSQSDDVGYGSKKASVACKSAYSGVTIRHGDCQYGEEIVGVGAPRDSYGSQRAKVACKSDYGGVSIRTGDCQYGETLIKVIE